MNDEEAETARRKFLKKAGKLAAYTPPAIMALMMPGEEAIASGGRPSKAGRDNRGRKLGHYRDR